jgi:hypothetical protein
MKQGFLKVLLVFYCRIIPSMLHIHLRLSTTCEPSKMRYFFLYQGKHGRQKHYHIEFMLVFRGCNAVNLSTIKEL